MPQFIMYEQMKLKKNSVICNACFTSRFEVVVIVHEIITG
jgi:hypothetical protein